MKVRKYEICDFCRKNLKKKRFSFINKEQFPSQYNFCSKTCKDRWLCNLKAQNSYYIKEWSIGKKTEKYFFIKKLFKEKGPNKEISYFSEDLAQINSFPLKKKKILKFLKAKV